MRNKKIKNLAPLFVLFFWGTVNQCTASSLNEVTVKNVQHCAYSVPGVKVEENIDTAEIKKLVKEDIKISAGSRVDSYRVEEGNLLLLPNKNITLSTLRGDISISRGAIIFLMAMKNGDIVIYDLSQSNHAQLKISINPKDQIVMQPGYTLVLTKLNISNFDELPSDYRSIFYLEAERFKIADKEIKVFSAEFSYRSALQKIQPLRELVSSNQKNDQIALNRILKTSLILGDFCPPPKDRVASKAKSD